MTKHLPKYLTQDEIARLFAAIPLPRDRALFAVIYHYGLRVDEATALTLEDLDLKNHRIRLRRLKNSLGGEKPLWRHTAKLGSYAPTSGSAGRPGRTSSLAARS